MVSRSRIRSSKTATYLDDKNDFGPLDDRMKESMMEPEQPEFELGETVQQKNQPEIIGVVRDRRWNEQAESWDYSVQFGARPKLVPSEQLQKLQLLASPWAAHESQAF